MCDLLSPAVSVGLVYWIYQRDLTVAHVHFLQTLFSFFELKSLSSLLEYFWYSPNPLYYQWYFLWWLCHVLSYFLILPTRYFFAGLSVSVSHRHSKWMVQIRNHSFWPLNTLLCSLSQKKHHHTQLLMAEIWKHFLLFLIFKLQVDSIISSC